ncbi:MAG: hypothetical protein PHS41_10330, partial [Victivallaceae bacterium]|nr:hypothetical protein [Victivallaceae bacterium]
PACKEPTRAGGAHGVDCRRQLGVAGLLFFGVSLLAERFPLRVTLLASPIAFLLLLPLLAWEIHREKRH